MEESSVREEKFRIGKNSSEEVEEKLSAFVFYPCLQRPYKIKSWELFYNLVKEPRVIAERFLQNQNNRWSRWSQHSSFVDGGWVIKSCPTLETPWAVACQAPLSMGFPSRNTEMHCHFLLQGIILTQGSNLSLLFLLDCRQILYCWATREASENIFLYIKLRFIHS